MRSIYNRQEGMKQQGRRGGYIESIQGTGGTEGVGGHNTISVLLIASPIPPHPALCATWCKFSFVLQKSWEMLSGWVGKGWAASGNGEGGLSRGLIGRLKTKKTLPGQGGAAIFTTTPRDVCSAACELAGVMQSACSSSQVFTPASPS